MEKKRQIALNKVFNLFILIGIILGYVAVLTFLEGDIKTGLILTAIVAVLLLIPIIATPCCYIFDTNGVTLYYVFLPKERYLWNNIRSITVESDDHHHIPFLSNVFRIVGCVEGKQHCYMEGKIRKSFRTKRLLETYWDGTITGYFFESPKILKNKKKSRISKHYLTDEISAMERKVRDKTRTFLKPFVDKARYQGLELKTSFCYTVGGKLLASRPTKDYNYIALIELLDKSNASRNTDVSVDLIYVHLGKSAYRGVKNEHAIEELKFYITDILNNSSR